MKIGIVILLITTVITTAVYYFNKHSGENTATTNIATVIVKASIEKKIERKKLYTQPDKQKEIPANFDEGLVKTADSNEYYLGESLFTQSEKAKEVLKASGKIRENLHGEVYLEINNAEITSLEIGDTFKLEIPALKMFYKIEVDKTHLDQFGNKTIEAILPDQEGKYSSIITVTDHSIYGNITTPHGIYAMEGNGQYAWIAETAGLIDGVIQDKMSSDDRSHTEHNPAPIDTGNDKRIGNNKPER